ncbi:MAG: NADPH-dependent glutamate synthase [Thermodesulforhabdaceae bacterium]
MSLTNKERMKIARQPMPAQDPVARRRNFDEVALGYTEELALTEANRCLQCKNAPCVEGCPVGVLIPQFIKALREGDMEGAVRAMKEKNSLPAVCGRVCPQEVQCEAKCVRGKKGEPVAIGRLERFVGDYELIHRVCPLEPKPPTGKKVAIAGTGPAGLSCAVDVAREGHEVTMFESLHEPGGVLTYGIPQFRLPKKIVADEISYAINCLGIKILTDHIVGKTVTVTELLDNYDAVFLGTGAGLPVFLNIPGINASGVLSANEFLTRVNLMKGYLFPEYDTPVKVGKKVAVIGGGNVAMDAARCALRLQYMRGIEGGEVHIVYRRSKEELPARAEEIHHAEEEGVIFDYLTSPIEVIADERGNVKALRCVKMKLGEPDSSGRRKPVKIEGSEFDMEVDMVIVAIGTNPNPLVFTEAMGLEKSPHGTVVVKDRETGRTTLPRVWAGGDLVTGAATVVSAMGAGKRAAADINRFLMGENTDW